MSKLQYISLILHDEDIKIRTEITVAAMESKHPLNEIIGYIDTVSYRNELVRANELYEELETLFNQADLTYEQKNSIDLLLKKWR